MLVDVEFGDFFKQNLTVTITVDCFGDFKLDSTSLFCQTSRDQPRLPFLNHILISLSALRVPEISKKCN